jgi:hypothetical protein
VTTLRSERLSAEWHRADLGLVSRDEVPTFAALTGSESTFLTADFGLQGEAAVFATKAMKPSSPGSFFGVHNVLPFEVQRGEPPSYKGRTKSETLERRLKTVTP